MIKLVTMSFPEFLNKKLLEWQFKEGKRKTLDNFAALLGIKRSVLSMWLNGSRFPGPNNQKKLIEMYGDEAAEALGEDPDLQAIIINWEYLTPEERSTHRRAVEEQASKYEAKRTHKARRTTSS